MVRVKVCGITSVEDGLMVVEAGAHAVGLVFYPPSPRHVDLARAAKIARALPPFVVRVGLFVNASREEITTARRVCQLDVLQLHGDETPADCDGLPARVVKGVRIGAAEDLDPLAAYKVSGLLLDAKVAGKYGGSGQSLDWGLLAGRTFPVPVILAGGLNPDNAAQAVAQVKPYGVDVSSGVESAPGKKDREKVKRFIAAVNGG